jgi:acyl-CoA synthetase (AMP-forming)/AMP-acid ligase II
VNPFSHSFGYRSGWVMALMFGATVWPLQTLDVPLLVDLIEGERITVLPGTPTLYQSLLDWPGLEGRDLSSLRLAWTGAMSIPPSLIATMRARLGLRDILTAYALTEATAVATLSRRGDPDEVIATTSGRALDDIEVRVASTGHALPPGEVGEIHVRGYNVMKGYLDDPAATAEAIDQDGWLRTGDIGALDEKGYLSISGRLKDMLIVGGFNVYPAEVENVLASHPGVAEAAVIGIPDRRMGEVAFAFIVARQPVTIDESGLIDWLRKRIANFKVPRGMRFVETLPRNALGKILKQELKKQLA